MLESHPQTKQQRLVLLCLIVGAMFSFYQSHANGVNAAGVQEAVMPPSFIPASVVHQQVKDYVEAVALKRYPRAQISVTINPIDTRIKMPACDSIQNSISGQRRSGRISIKVHCLAPQTWTTWLTGEINVEVEMAVANVTIKRKSIIQDSDVSIQYRSINQTGNRYLSNLERVKGWEARRDISEGSIIYPQQLQAARLIRKGERVQIASASRGFSIAASGIALSDGTQGQQIAVRNQQSQRVIHAWVTDPGTVSLQP